MAVNTKYKLAKYDLTKGMRSEAGKARDQGLIPRLLVDLTYNGTGLLSNRKAVTATLGVYSAKLDVAPDAPFDGETDGDYIWLDDDMTGRAKVSNLCSDGERIFGQTSIRRIFPGGWGKYASYVCEMKKQAAGNVWMLTDIPAPKAVVPLASLDPMTSVSVGSGANSGEVLIVNTKRYTSSGSTTLQPSFTVVSGDSAITDTDLFDKPSLGRFANITYTKACGSGFSVAYDTGLSQYRLFNHSGLVVRSWILRGVTDVETAYTSDGIFDAYIVGSALYLVTKHTSNNDIYFYRYGVPVVSTGSTESSPGSSYYILATHATSETYASEIHTALHISQECEYYLNVGHAYHTRSGTTYTNTVKYYRRVKTTVAANDAYYVTDTAKPGPVMYVTCNDSLVLAESIDNDGATTNTTDEFTQATTSGNITYPVRKSCKVYGYTLSATYPNLVETDLFMASGKAFIGPSLGTPSYEKETYLYSHLSTNGYVCIGDSIYQMLLSDSEAVSVRFICKAIDVPSSGSAYGSMNVNALAEYSGRAARKGNAISRWVADRYVALPVGGYEVARGGHITGTVVPALNEGLSYGMSSNDRLVLFDVQDIPLTAVQVSSGVTSFGHGWSISKGGEVSMSCSADRPTIRPDDITYGTAGSNDLWDVGDIFTYRAVLVCSIGGIESYISSPSVSITTSGNEYRPLIIPVYVNRHATTSRTIRLYRNRSPDDPANDYQFVSEKQVPLGSSSVSFYDYNNLITAKPFDPTGGGDNYSQGLFISGLRDIANVAGRSYVVTSTAAYACQVGGGDDMLPTPMPDSEIIIPGRHGKVKHISSLADTAIVTTETSILGIGGNPPNVLGQGGGQGVYIISEGVGANCKPVETPAGLVVGDDANIVLVDRSRSAQNISGPVSSFTYGGSMTYCAPTGEVVISTTDATYPWLVLDTDGGRWTTWTVGAQASLSAAASSRGALKGVIAFADLPEFDGAFNSTSTGYIDTTSGSTYAAPKIHLGWDSFPDRFTVSNLRAIHVDGWGAATVGSAVTCASSFDLSYGTFTETNDTGGGSTQNALSRDDAGFRASLYPQRIQATSFRNVLTFATTEQLQIDTIAVEVLPGTANYSSGE